MEAPLNTGLFVGFFIPTIGIQNPTYKLNAPPIVTRQFSMKNHAFKYNPESHPTAQIEFLF